MRTAINLFTVREIDEPLPTVLEEAAAAGYDGVEFIHRLPDAEIEAIVETLDETGLEAPAAHLAPFTELDGVPEVFDDTADVYEAVGVEFLALSISGERLETRDRIEETASKLDQLTERVGDRGFELLYHNHHWEFDEVDGESRFDRLLNGVDERIGIELDAGWAAAGGADPVELIDQLGDRLRILHIKDADVAEKESVEVGTGDVDLEACIRAAEDAGVQWFIYEHDEPVDPHESMETGASFLSQFD